MMIVTFIIFIVPLVAIILALINKSYLGLTACLMLIIYSSALIVLLALEKGRTLTGNLGLLAMICLLTVALVASLRRGFLLLEGRKRRKQGLEELLSSYDR